MEFPGCIATGDTPAETFSALEDVACSWLEAALEHNQPIPEPVENTAFSGRLVLRLPKSLHKKAALYAERDGVSLNQFIIMSVAEHVGTCASSQSNVTVSTLIAGGNTFVAAAQFSAISSNPAVVIRTPEPVYNART
jgi:antitoxin HicB